MQQGEDGHLELSVLPLPSRIFVPGVRGGTQEGKYQYRAVLVRLLRLFPRLRAVVLVGRKVQSARAHLGRLTGARVFPMLHPSN